MRSWKRVKPHSRSRSLKSPALNTKRYVFIPLFQPGGADPGGSFDLGHIRQAIWRAAMLPGHRIAIDAYEDRNDPSEGGAAARRIHFLRSCMVAEGVLEQRIAVRAHIDEERGDFARRAEIRLFPVLHSRSGASRSIMSTGARVFPLRELAAGLALRAAPPADTLRSGRAGIVSWLPPRVQPKVPWRPSV